MDNQIVTLNYLNLNIGLFLGNPLPCCLLGRVPVYLHNYFRLHTFVKTFLQLKMDKRLQQFLAAENISQSSLADSLGVTRASITHILSGRNRPGFDFIEQMALHYPSLSLDWLITGKGRMYKDADGKGPEMAGKRIIGVTVFYDDNTFVELH